MPTFCAFLSHNSASISDIQLGCSLSPILFSVFINDLLIEVEKAGLGVQLKGIGSLLFADDFVGMSDSRENLQQLYIYMYN